MEGNLTIEVHHSGKFVEGWGLIMTKIKKYKGGKVDCFKVDVDLLSYFEILGYIKDLGYTDLCKLYFKSPVTTMDFGLKFLYNDEQIPTLLEDAKECGRIQIYVDHFCDEVTLEPVENHDIRVDSTAQNDIGLDEVQFEVGLRFSNPNQFKDAVRNYAVANGLALKFLKNKHSAVQVGCKGGKGNCPWKVYASWMNKEKTFQIKSLIDQHKCSRGNKVALGTSTWLAKVYGDKIRSNPTWKTKDFKEEVNNTYKFTVSRVQCYRAKKKALGEVENGLIEHYSNLRSYGREIIKSDKRNTVKVCVHRGGPDEPAVFKRMYISFYALRNGWKVGCRPVLGLDGSFLKSYCCGEILTAVGRDGNNQMYPVAWAVVEVESTESWTWFIDILKDDLDLNQGIGLTVITDQQKGLENAIAELLPHAEHRCCARHIYSNLRKKYTGAELKNLFWKAAKCSTPEDFEAVLKEIKQVNVDAWNWIKRHNPKIWCRGFFSLVSKCESVDNNMCECFNGTILDARYKPVIDMLEEIRVGVKERMERRRKIMEKWDGDYCPRIIQRLDKNIDDHRFFCTSYNGNYKFEIRMGLNGYVVDTKSKTCSCRMWELSGIPCSHAISAIYYLNDEPLNYIDPILSVDKCKLAYSEFMSPINGKNMWPKDESDPILPPPNRRMPGRPKKARRKGINEETRKVGGKHKLRGAARDSSCANCHQNGHNRRSCKNATVAIPKVVKKTQTVRQKKDSNQSGTSNSRPSKPVRTTRHIGDSIPNGFGIFISPESGSTFLRNPGMRAPVNLNQTAEIGVSTQASYANQSSQPTQSSRNQTSSPAHNTRSKTTIGGPIKKTLGVKRKIFKK